MLRWSIRDYDYASLDELASAFKGYQEAELEEWKRARMVSFYSCAPHVKEFKKPSDLFKLEGDEKKLDKTKTVKVTKLIDGKTPDNW